MNSKKTPKAQQRWSRRHVLKGMAATSAALYAAPGRIAYGEELSADVLILGAGLAGLNAALNLEDFGVKVKILEGNNRIGGRLYTAPENEVPGRPEMGGSGIGSHYARTLYAANRFNVKMEKSRPRTEPRKSELMYHVRGQAIQADEWPTHALNPFQQKANRSKKLSSFQYLVYSEDDNPFPKGDFEAWQSGQYGALDISVHDYLVSKGYPAQAIKLGAGTNMSYGTNTHDLSVLMGFQSSNLIRSLYRGENALPAQSLAAAGGNQRIPEAIAAGLNSPVVLNQHVRSIKSNNTGVVVTTFDGQIYRSKHCICTFPFSALRHVHVEPYFQGLQAEAVQTIGYTPVFQAHFVPTKPYWEIDGLPPSMWTDRVSGRFMALKNDPKNLIQITSCVSFVNGEMAKYLDRLDPRQAAKTILDQLAVMRPATQGALKLVKVHSWNRTPFAGGAYAYWKPSHITRLSKTMRTPNGRIHLAGEHTAVLNRGMEGAMESGERAALEVIEAL